MATPYPVNSASGAPPPAPPGTPPPSASRCLRAGAGGSRLLRPSDDREYSEHIRCTGDNPLDTIGWNRARFGDRHRYSCTPRCRTAPRRARSAWRSPAGHRPGAERSRNPSREARPLEQPSPVPSLLTRCSLKSMARLTMRSAWCFSAASSTKSPVREASVSFSNRVIRSRSSTAASRSRPAAARPSFLARSTSQQRYPVEPRRRAARQQKGRSLRAQTRRRWRSRVDRAPVATLFPDGSRCSGSDMRDQVLDEEPVEGAVPSGTLMFLSRWARGKRPSRSWPERRKVAGRPPAERDHANSISPTSTRSNTSRQSMAGRSKAARARLESSTE